MPPSTTRAIRQVGTKLQSCQNQPRASSPSSVPHYEDCTSHVCCCPRACPSIAIQGREGTQVRISVLSVDLLGAAKHDHRAGTWDIEEIGVCSGQSGRLSASPSGDQSELARRSSRQSGRPVDMYSGSRHYTMPLFPSAPTPSAPPPLRSTSLHSTSRHSHSPLSMSASTPPPRRLIPAASMVTLHSLTHRAAHLCPTGASVRAYLMPAPFALLTRACRPYSVSIGYFAELLVT